MTSLPSEGFPEDAPDHILTPGLPLGDELEVVEECMHALTALRQVHFSSFAHQAEVFGDQELAYETRAARNTIEWYLTRSLIADFADDKQEIPNERDARGRTAWKISELAMVSTIDGGMLSADSLVSSIESGAIRAITGDDERLVDALSKVLAHYNIPVQPSSPTGPNDPYKMDIEATPNRDFFEHALAETAHIEQPGRHIKGPYASQFEQVAATIRADLSAIHPALPLGVLHPEGYRDPSMNVLLRECCDIEQFKAVFDLRETYAHRFQSVADRLLPLNAKHVIEGEVLNKPRYIRQVDSIRCASTAFRMVFHGVTGDAIGERDMQDAMRNGLGTSTLLDEDYLKIFGTPVFKERYPEATVQTMSFSGMNLDTIAKLATKIKQTDKSRKVFVVASLRTDTSSDPNIQHRVVLLGAGSKYVRFHDSAVQIGQAERRILKTDFYDRWATAQNSGYMVITA